MKKTKEFILRQIADEYLLIPTGQTCEEFNGMITLSETAAYIYEHLEEAESFEKLIEMITQEYEIDPKTAASDAYELLNGMLKNGLIGLSDPKVNW